MLSALLDANVEFVVVGAFALAAHGNPRSTGDIDLFVRPSRENAGRVKKALGTFGAHLENISVDDLESLDVVLQIGVAPRRIDILTSLDGLNGFDEAIETSVTTKLDGLDVPVLGREVLIRNKTALGRPQDLADVAWLKGNP